MPPKRKASEERANCKKIKVVHEESGPKRKTKKRKAPDEVESTKKVNKRRKQNESINDKNKSLVNTAGSYFLIIKNNNIQTIINKYFKM